MKASCRISCLVFLLVLTCVGQAQAEVEFKKTPFGGGEKLTCSRDGVLIYELISKGGESGSEQRLYTFYWKSKKAIQVLKVGKSTTIQTFPMTEVSYSVDLDPDGELGPVIIEDINGKILEGILRKKDGLLWPTGPPPEADQ